MPQNIAKSAVERTSKRLLDEVFVSLGKVKRRAVCLRFRLCKGDSPFCMLPTINIYSTAYTEGADPFIPASRFDTIATGLHSLTAKCRALHLTVQFRPPCSEFNFPG